MTKRIYKGILLLLQILVPNFRFLLIVFENNRRILASRVSWEGGGRGKGAEYALSILLLSELLLKCQPAILPPSGEFYFIQEG